MVSYALRGQGRFAEGAEVLETLAARDPTYAATALETLGELWAEAGDAGRARAAFSRALARDPALSSAARQLRTLDAAPTAPVR